MNNKKENKPTVLILHPTRYCERSLKQPSICNNYDLIWYPESIQPQDQITHPLVGPLTTNIHPLSIIENIRMLADTHKIDGIISAQDYPGNILASIIAQERNLSAPNPKLVTGFQHKIYSRLLQQQHVPLATPKFFSISRSSVTEEEKNTAFPFFIKPVKANFSIFAQTIQNKEQLFEFMNNCQLPDSFIDQFDWYIRNAEIVAASSAHYIAEELLQGKQVTLEGFVCNNEVTIIGVVDSIMYPGTICFERFVYPSALSDSVQQRMAVIATQLMRGVGYNNGFFNIEFMYNLSSDSIRIIEINPRMASQFADLYEKVDGHNTYDLLLSVATQRLPLVKRKEGNFSISASCVLRIFENKKIVAIPTDHHIQKLKEEFSEAEVFIKVQSGQLLSDIEQDGKSFAYALIHLGARDETDINRKLVECKKLLPFIFAPIA